MIREEWKRLGFEEVNIQSEETMGDRLDDLPNELNPIKQLKELKTILLDRHHIADCEALDIAITTLEAEEDISKVFLLGALFGCFYMENDAETLSVIKKNLI